MCDDVYLLLNHLNKDGLSYYCINKSQGSKYHHYDDGLDSLYRLDAKNSDQAWKSSITYEMVFENTSPMTSEAKFSNANQRSDLKWSQHFEEANIDTQMADINLC